MLNLETVSTISRGIFQATADVTTGRTNYLRIILKATQDDLKRGAEITDQLAALNAVHEQAYDLVLKAAEEFVPRGTKNRGAEIHKKANFARTALSALRGHVRAGGDLKTLKAETITKAALKVREGPQRTPSPRRLRARAESQSKALVATLLGLADVDKAAAIDEMQLVLGQLTQQLMAMGVISTSDAKQSVAEHRPLKIGKTLFVPTETTVLRNISVAKQDRARERASPP
jgi:hypothetical protein